MPFWVLTSFILIGEEKGTLFNGIVYSHKEIFVVEEENTVSFLCWSSSPCSALFIFFIFPPDYKEQQPKPAS